MSFESPALALLDAADMACDCDRPIFVTQLADAVR
jgi:hypothetical protein